MDDLKNLFDHVADKTPDYTRIGLVRGDLKLVVERSTAASAISSSVSAQPASAVSISSAPDGINETPGAMLVKSPIVGTFYASPAPDAPPFVSVGQTVKKGQVLCIIEAMKMMNEIESDADGVISRVLAENGALVEYGQSLFELA